MAELNTVWTAASEEIYKAQQTGSTAANNAGAQQEQQGAKADGDNVTDAEFEEVK
jgi:molecular chaperone DnaK